MEEAKDRVRRLTLVTNAFEEGVGQNDFGPQKALHPSITVAGRKVGRPLRRRENSKNRTNGLHQHDPQSNFTFRFVDRGKLCRNVLSSYAGVIQRPYDLVRRTPQKEET